MCDGNIVISTEAAVLVFASPQSAEWPSPDAEDIMALAAMDQS